MSILVVIPARMGSTRLPNKPLRSIAGEAMIARTAKQALKSHFPVYIAYDDERIAQCVADLPVHTVATDSGHQNGSERISEVVVRQGWDDDVIVVNVQGDEPLIPPQCIIQVAETLQNAPHAGVATLAAPIHSREELLNPNIVKVVRAANGQALYFSRAALPFVRDIPSDEQVSAFPFLRHIGIYAYRVSVLKQYPHLPPAPLESAEKLEQLRFLEHGINIAVGVVKQLPPPGVDCEADVARIEAILAQQS